jgi:hypothetical protein
VDSTDRHLYFANVLQRTLQTLLPVDELRKRYSTAGAPSANTSPTEPTRSDDANAFSLFKVDETEDEDFHLATAAVTTNTAYDLMRHAEDDFNREMRIPKEYAGRFPDGSMVELYYIDSCLRAGLEPKERGRQTIVDFEHWLIVQESFQLPHRLLVSFRQVANERGSMPLTRPGGDRDIYTWH